MDFLKIPLEGIDFSKLTDKQKDHLIKICQNTITEFLKDPSLGRERILQIVLELTPLDLSESQTEELLHVCYEEFDYYRFNGWDDGLFEIINEWLSENDLILKEEKEEKLC